MEFLRFGSSIPGSYWGTCSVCIIQNFKTDPDTAASIEIVSGDGGNPIIRDFEAAFLGKTYKEIFLQRLRIGTFGADDMPNHAFLAILTQEQIDTSVGKKWLALLKENGFEFIRTVDNSVYSGDQLYKDMPENYDDDDDYYEESSEPHPNYIFGLFRNIGAGRISDPFQPPQEWLDLEGGVKEMSQLLVNQGLTDLHSHLQESRDAVHLSHWDKIGPVTFLKRQELVDAGVPVILAGLRSEYKQETEQERAAKMDKNPQLKTSTASPW
jgi:hypothetical protein